MENVITLGKLIVLVFYSVSPSSLFFFENSEKKRNDLARPVMGTIFLVYISREISIEHTSVGLASLAQIFKHETPSITSVCKVNANRFLSRDIILCHVCEGRRFLWIRVSLLQVEVITMTFYPEYV